MISAIGLALLVFACFPGATLWARYVAHHGPNDQNISGYVHEGGKKIPVVALTGHALAGHSKGAKEAGCDSFLAKPCLPDQLVAEIRRMLEGGKPAAKAKGAR